MTISELRILPPLAIARLGAGSVPMDNYSADVDPNAPLSFRRLVPARTLMVDPTSGEIEEAIVPERLRFTEAVLDAGGTRRSVVRPVAPFLEVWAVVDGDLVPLTQQLLEAEGASPSEVRWSVHLGNHKVFRRTFDPDDRVEARFGPFSDHDLHEMLGECVNFWPGKALPLGWVRYVRPNAAFPEIRLRFIPAHGYVYGSSKKQPPETDDPNVHDVLYDASPGRGTWLGYADGTAPTNTNPAQIYANKEDAAGNAVSLGYMDDECDGVVRVELDLGGRQITAFARVAAGPPAYAPDVRPIRTIAQELEQALLGPDTRPADVRIEEAEEVLRRAFETIRLMNTAAMNGNPLGGRPNAASTMVRQDSNDTGRLWEPIMDPALVDTMTLLNLHQTILTALRSGTAVWFLDALRRYDEVADLSDKGRRKMPALMRGADSRSLALTRRHVSMFTRIARRDLFEESERDDAARREGDG